jgi:predicted RNA-binding protein YlqC (UPF0109 family)
LLSKIIHAIIEHPEDLIICEMRQDETLAFTISGSPHDLSLLIGRQGQTAKSIRTIIRGVGVKLNRRYDVIVQDNPHTEDAPGV